MFKYEKQKSNINGLSFIPNLVGQNDRDFINNVNGIDLSYKHGRVPEEFSVYNKTILANTIKDLRYQNALKCVVEIGVNRSGNKSSTQFILQNKDPETIYIGIDINPQMIESVYCPEKNTFGLVTDSSNHSKIMEYLIELKAYRIDLFMIDGNHSINQVCKDWVLTNALNIGGYVLLHDTNYHPGPYCVYEAIDEEFYEKQKYFTDMEFDWGIAKAKKIKEYQ